MESEVLKTGMNLIMEKQIIPNPICPNGCIYRLTLIPQHYSLTLFISA